MLSRVLLQISFSAALLTLSSCRSQNSSVSEPQAITSGQHLDGQGVYAMPSGSSSFVYLVDTQTSRRLTKAISGWEADPVLSSDGRLVAYSSGATQSGRADIWVAHVDGSHAHRVSSADQDSLMPAFSPDGRTVFYVISRSYGHSSPIAASRRHDFDVVKVGIDPDGPIAGSMPVELTQSYFYDVQSLSISPNGEEFLLSTSGYPVGSLLQEFRLDHPLRQHRIFQPHVPQESSMGASLGQARYLGDGLEIAFLAASQPASGGNYDYNVYRMSEVTGADITGLTHHSGMIDSLSVGPQRSVGYTDANGYAQITLPAEPSR